jgi:hypothetical protein
MDIMTTEQSQTLTKAEKLRAIASILDFYDEFVKEMQQEFPDFNWDAFPFAFDGTEDDTEMQNELRQWADELDSSS